MQIWNVTTWLLLGEMSTLRACSIREREWGEKRGKPQSLVGFEEACSDNVAKYLLLGVLSLYTFPECATSLEHYTIYVMQDMHRYMLWLLVWVPDATRTRSRWTWQTAVVLMVPPLDGKEGCKLLDWPTSRPVSLVILLWCPLWLVSSSNSQSQRSTVLIMPSSLSDLSTWPYWAIQLSSSADSIPGKSPKNGCYLEHSFYLLNKNMGKHLKKKQTNKQIYLRFQMHFEWWCHFLVCPKQIRQAFLQTVYHPSHPLHRHGLLPIEEIFMVISCSF